MLERSHNWTNITGKLSVGMIGVDKYPWAMVTSLTIKEKNTSPSNFLRLVESCEIIKEKFVIYHPVTFY